MNYGEQIWCLVIAIFGGLFSTGFWVTFMAIEKNGLHRFSC